MTLLDIQNLSVSYGEKTILDRVSFSVREGCWLMIVGPNGAGKSTVVGAVSQLTPHSGLVTCMGQNVRRMKPHKLARLIGVLPQSSAVSYAFTVEEILRMGRYSHSPGFFSGRGSGDEAILRRAAEMTGLADLLDRSVLTLSGGELQRTFLAQLFAQDPKILILDEPTNHLDLIYQKQIFSLVSEWLTQPGRAVVSVVHDLSLAKAYGTDALLLSGGRAVASGEIGSVFSREALRRVYSMDVYQWMEQMLGQWAD
ncbi:MAG: ABC transporter ATP-binding protein [Oscillospiraceae bacterium]|jgi:iron complex transport system ATP-binding protein|nr:ABC transporter ATP-binding protein [Oscillospiraceae bacterium]